MKSLWHCRKNNRAFTLVEMLVVIAIIAILAALLLPTLVHGKQRAQRVECIGNLRETGTAFNIFAHDHQGKFPMQIPQAEGGSQEYVTAGNNIAGVIYFSYRHLQTLANELVVPRILICPADLTREPAPSFGVLQNSNVSYFVGVYADFNEPSSVLAGDRNITNNTATASLVRGGYGLRWNNELHYFKGNVLFSDTHVEQMNNTQIELPSRTQAGVVLALPAVKPPSPAGSGPVMAQNPSSSTASIQESAPSQQGVGRPGNPAPNIPAPQSPRPSRSGMASSQMAANQGSNAPAFVEIDAKEKKGDAALSDVPPTAPAPAADDYEPPLVWLQGAAKAGIANMGGWLWVLLLLLIAALAYWFSRRKKRPVKRR